MNTDKKTNLLDKINDFLSFNKVEAEVVVKEEAAPEATEAVEAVEPVATTEKFETVLLADGATEVTIEPAIEVGAAIVITAEDGTPVAAPAGDYPLQDGRVVVVAEDGVVAEVKESETEEEPLAEDKPQEADKVKRIIERIESEKIFSRLEDLEAKQIALEETNKFLKEENEVLTEKSVETEKFAKETLTEVVELLGKEPTQEPAQKQNPLQAMFGKEEDGLDAWLNKHN